MFVYNTVFNKSSTVKYDCNFISEIKVASVRELAKLRDSEQLKKVMSQIDKYSKVPRKSADIIGPVESDPEYQLIVEANNMAVDIDDEIGNSINQIF